MPSTLRHPSRVMTGALAISALMTLGVGCATSAPLDDPMAPARANEPTSAHAPTSAPIPALDVAAAQAALDAAHAQATGEATREAMGPIVAATSAHVDQAIEATDARLGAVWRASVAQPSYPEVLQAWRDPQGSMSMGTTSQGSLRGAVELALDGAHHTIIERARGRNTRWGHPSLVHALHDVGSVVAAQAPDSKLAVGNISRPRGRRHPLERLSQLRARRRSGLLRARRPHAQASCGSPRLDLVR